MLLYHPPTLTPSIPPSPPLCLPPSFSPAINRTRLNNVCMQLRKNCNHPDLLTSRFDGSCECVQCTLCNQRMGGWVAACLGGWVVGWLGGWVVGWLCGWVVGWLCGWVVGWLGGWVVGWLCGWVVGWLGGCVVG